MKLSVLAALPAAVLLLLAHAAPAAAMNDNWAAAACSAYGPKCWSSLARTSGVCYPARWMSAQPKPCIRAACRYCYQYRRRVTVPVCRKLAIVKNCFNGKQPGGGGGDGPTPPKPTKKPTPPKPTKKPTPPSPNSAGCVYRGSNGKVVIPAVQLKISYPWTRVGNSIVWRKNGGGGIDPKGTSPVCAKVVFPSSGIYYLTGVTSAPHPTEHNDAWFRFSGGFNLYRPQSRSFRQGNNDWYKAYQNQGGNKPANYLVTIDFNGHQFLTKPVVAGRQYTVCVAGRSSKYSIYKIVFVKCAGGAACSRFNSAINKAMQSLPPSRCSR